MASDEGLVSLLGKEAFFTTDKFACDYDDLSGHTLSELEHARGVSCVSERNIGGAGCSDWDIDRYLLQACKQFEYDENKAV